MNFVGLAELQEQLRRLPASLAGQASGIVVSYAEKAASEMFYPLGTELAQNVKVTPQNAGQFGARAMVKNSDKKAWWWEHGTATRHTKFGKDRGRMTPQHTFLPPVIRNRGQMYEALREMLVENGLKTRGTMSSGVSS